MEKIIKKKDGFRGQKAVVIPRQVLQTRCAENVIIKNLYVTDIGYYPKAQFHYRERVQGAAQHILIYCHEGRGMVKIGINEYKMEPGDFVVIPAKKNHSYSADETNPWTIYWMHFKGAAANEIVDKFQKKTGLKGFILFKEKSIELFNKIYTQLERGYSSDNLMYANMCLWHFITTFLFNEKDTPPDKSGNKDAIDEAIDFMNNHIDSVLSLGVISGHVNISPSHFSYLFKKKTGFSPIEYFNHLKVQRACQYLLFTQLRINEISQELGVEDPYYFSRMFTKVMGMSPNEYREKRIR